MRLLELEKLDIGINAATVVSQIDKRDSTDNLDHGHLRQFPQLRVRDGVLLRLIGKWLRAGVMDRGCISYQPRLELRTPTVTRRVFLIKVFPGPYLKSA